MKEDSQNVNNLGIVSIKDQFNFYLRFWPWFLASVIMSMTVAFLYLRYTNKEYQVRSSILIKDTNNNQLSELAAFEDLGLAGSGLTKSEFENEIEIIKSKKLAREVVLDLNLFIKYYKEGDVRNLELFRNCPIRLILNSDPENIESNHNFVIKPQSIKTFKLSYSFFDDNGQEVEVSESYRYGDKIDAKTATFTVLPNTNQLESYLKKNQGQNIICAISSIDYEIRNLQNLIKVISVNDESSVVTLNMVYSVPEKAKSILNKLVEKYNKDAVSDKNQVSKNTADFIERRLALIAQELDSVESDIVAYKENRKLTNVESEGQIFLENASEYTKKALEIGTQKELVSNYIAYLDEEEKTLPINLGLEGHAADAIQNYNQLILEKERLLSTAGENNPVIIRLNQQIEQIKNNIRQNLINLRETISIQENDLLSQRQSIEGQIGEIPTIEKQLRDIVRQQNIKESLYLYLLQKREETAISLAVTTPKAKIVDEAYSSIEPVSPKTKFIFLGSFIIGILVPFCGVYIKNLTDTKIHNRQDVEDVVSDVPVLGEIPQVDKGDKDTIKANDRSVLAEAFRIVRTNLSYLLVSGMEERKIIYITSTIKGEGKTFVASNLALTLTSTGKKILLIGADIRNPQIHRYVNKPEGKGLSEFLFDDKISHDSIINEVEIHRQKFDVILSGRIPPNPAELLMSKRFKELLDNVRDTYDYVLVDTAPTMLVTDTLLISQYADLTVYITRAEYTEKKLLNYPKELIETGKLKNIAFLVNDVSQANFGYGTKYGYGYGVEKKKWYEQIYAAFQTRSKFRD